MDRHDKGDANEQSCTSRRAFCAEMLSTGLILAAAPNIAKSMTTQDSMVAYPPKKIDGAELLMPGSSLYFNYPTRNDPAVLLRAKDGEYNAYSRRCSHAGCSVDYEPSNQCLKCPCHRGTFDAMGYVMFGPPRRPLDSIILQVRAGGQLWAVGKSFGREGEVITRGERR